MNLRNNAILTFDSSIPGEIVRLNIPRADMSLTTERAQAGMQALIDSGVVLTTNGAPTAIRTADIVTTTRAPLVNA
jgi:NADH/NAD ratio-sensing transcriptional regulator Rex